MEFMILDRNILTGENNNNDSLEKIIAKLTEEVAELNFEICDNNILNIAAEAQDVAQVLIRLFTYLQQVEGVTLDKVNTIHNNKLITRGWITKGIIKLI